MGQVRYTDSICRNLVVKHSFYKNENVTLKEGEENMLEAFFKGQGVFYVIIMLCAVGIAGKCYESKLYGRLLKAVENPELTDHPFLKQLKLKYKNYYMLERKIHNTDAFVETNLFRYKHRYIGLENLHTINSRIMLLCIIVSCIGVAACVHFELQTGLLMYHILVGAIAVAVLELTEQQFGIDNKRRMLFVSLKDYLENGLTNQLDNRIREADLECKNREKVKTVEVSKANIVRNDVRQEDTTAVKSGDRKSNPQNQVQQQMAVTETIAEKVAAELAQEKVIAEVIKEFFP